MRVLVLNDFFCGWSGSEIVALEVVEHFSATSSSFWCAEPMKSILGDWRPLDEVTLSEFDLVWAQQHTILNLLQNQEDGERRPFIVWAPLSPYEPMERVPDIIRKQYFDFELANSPETARELGIEDSFFNAAPMHFHVLRKHRELRRIVVVSNHVPDEVQEACNLLSQAGFEIRVIGKLNEKKRVEPIDILSADCIISIGKTVRYALAAGVPVYVYDRFGGDGYVKQENYARNEYYNFSGRPRCRKISAEEIADEIVRYYRDWIPPAQVTLGAILTKIEGMVEPRTFNRYPDLAGLAAMSSSVGAWLCEAHQLRAYENGDVGSWRWLFNCFRKKVRRSSSDIKKILIER